MKNPGLVLFFVVALFSGAAQSPAVTTTTLIDGCEDTLYATYAAAGDSIVLTNSSEHTQGNSSLQITYNYQPQGAWYKDGRVEKVFPTPVDLRGMEHISFDLRVPTANTDFILIVSLEDSQGIQMRYVYYNSFGAANTEFQTKTVRFSGWQKTRWATGGRAVNLNKISKLIFRLQNQTALTVAGSHTFRIDNVRFDGGAGVLTETNLENFESYTDNAALAAQWAPINASTTVSLVTATQYAGAKSMRIQANVAARSTLYGAQYTLPAPADFSATRYFKIAVYGSAKLIAFNPIARLDLIDAHGNRALGCVWLWPAKAEWCEIYLPFSGDGIEPWSSAATLAWDGNSCWREDATDPGGWSANCDLTSITKLRLGFETQNTGAYPVNGVELWFDNIIAGNETTLDTPAALNTALMTANNGALLPLGYTTADFGAGAFLNQGARMMTELPGTLVYSDDPEFVSGFGILYRDRLPAGKSRIYLYHASNNSASSKVTAVLQNAGTAAAHVTFTRKALPNPSTDYVGVGRTALKQYYESLVMPSPLSIAPGSAALLDPAVDGKTVTRNQLLHSIHDFTSDQPLTVTSLMLRSSASTLSTFASQSFLPDDGYYREGTYPMWAKENTTPYPCDTVNGIQRVRVADWNQNIDPFVTGWDAESGAANRLLGNYGVTYTIRISVTSSDGRRLAVIFSTPDDSCGYGGYARWRFPESATPTTQLVPNPASSIAPGQGGLCAKIAPTLTPQTLLLETIPAGSSCLPFDIHLVPYKDYSAVTDHALY
ncbi:MAG: hypothetical protein WCK47_15270 [bacterium]